ncbi:family 16 glycosylhydrolase [Streptomyces sp. NPDC004435]|uniref:glycoside hydrolase family 16 protein n=1 Tax=Streptomyces sp. NPDC004435 TaxID=3364701 RepID=UPI0036BC7CCD
MHATRTGHRRPIRTIALRTGATLGALALLAAAQTTTAASTPRNATAPLVDPATPAGAQPQLPTGPRTAAQTLVFSDEFTQTSLDTTRWTARDQERTEASRTDGIRWWYKPANVRLIPDNGGNLAIDLRKLTTNQYAGGRVDTQDKFDYAYGTLEARIHTPYATNGHLAAVWVQAPNHGTQVGTAADGAEYDIIETSRQNDQYPVSIHYDGYAADHKVSSQTVNAPGLHSTWYHTVGMAWTPTQIQFTFDGAVVRTVTDPKLISQVREFPILSHELLFFAEGSLTSAPLDASSTVYVDYLRIWQ